MKAVGWDVAMLQKVSLLESASVYDTNLKSALLFFWIIKQIPNTKGRRSVIRFVPLKAAVGEIVKTEHNKEKTRTVWEWNNPDKETVS
jgi:hypothetical protein